MSYILKTCNLTKAYDGKPVVSDVNIHISKGEIYGFLGPNGAGKTTVMKMIANLVKPTGGEIEIFGEKLMDNSYEFLKRIGSIIEYPIFYDKLTARENLELHCEYMGYHNKKAIDEALELVDLKGIDKKAVKNFSLGMKQRLGIARAITTKPELLILDEPINGLDPIGIKEMRKLFKCLCQEHRITILVSSHILGEIEQIADTIGVINNGILVQEVSMDRVRESNLEYLELVVEDCNKAASVLYDMSIANFKVLDNNSIRIYDMKQTKSNLLSELVRNNIAVESISSKNSSLEDYFLNLLNGGGISA